MLTYLLHDQASYIFLPLRGRVAVRLIFKDQKPLQIPAAVEVRLENTLPWHYDFYSSLRGLCRHNVF